MSVENAAQHHVTLHSGSHTRYRRLGDGPPLVLLHGIGRSLEDFAAVEAPLAEKFTVYSLDLPGSGESERMLEPTTLGSLARSVLDFLDAVDETRPIRLIGNALGGAIALQVAALEPDRIAALILVNSAGFGSEVMPALRLASTPGLGRLLVHPNRRASKRTVQSTVYDQAFATLERSEQTYRLSRRPGAAAVLHETARSLLTWRGIRPEWRQRLLADLSNIDVPMLLLWGDKDAVLPAHHFEAAKAAFPQARSYLFGRTGQMPQVERADEFAHLVLAFLHESDASNTSRASRQTTSVSRWRNTSC